MKKTLLPMMMFTALMSAAPMMTIYAQAISPAVQSIIQQPISYINTYSLKVRSTPEDNAKSVGALTLNDQVRVINPTTIYANKYVEVAIVKSEDDLDKAAHYYVNKDYLSNKITDYKEFTGKYFIVVNVATETIRVYEKGCPDFSCPNKMILESEVVVGEDVDHPADEKGKGRSVLGSYRIAGWTKFYQDGGGHYPAWFREGYPDLPKPGNNGLAWFSKSSMPKDPEEHNKRHGVMRGAFGWYTAFVEPQAMGQWLHGTIGWGADKDSMIKRTKKTLLNIFSNPRSSGCTRNNNEAIAFIRSLLDVGTPLIKIYAKEELLDPTLSKYPNQTEDWQYVLTKNTNHAIARDEVLKSLGLSAADLDAYWNAKLAGGDLVLDPKSPLSQILEVGTYQKDIHPDVIEYTPGEDMSRFSRKIGRKGNVYGIPSAQMHGVYYVDAGFLNEYAHPETVLEVSGFKDEMTPPWMKFTNLKP